MGKRNNRQIRVTRVGPQNSGVLSIIRDPEIYERISDDRCPPADECVLPEWAAYVLGFLDDEPVSLFIEHDKQVHFMVLKEYRRETAAMFWWMSVAELGLERMVAEIPVCYPEVIRFVERQGMRFSGMGESIPKNGIMVPRVRLEYGFCI